MEERNIKISIEKAREWYSYGGELKKLALSVFTEKEIKENVLPNTWEEFFEMYLLEKDKKEWYIDVDSTPRYKHKGVICFEDSKNVLPSKQAAFAHLAYMQLHQLRNCYRQGWKPNWSNGNQCKWCIVFDTDKFMIQTMYFRSHFLSFQSEEIARKFLNNFQELIKLAGDLI